MTPKMKAQRALKIGRYVAVFLFSLMVLYVIAIRAYFGIVLLFGMLCYIFWHLKRTENLLLGVDEPNRDDQ